MVGPELIPGTLGTMLENSHLKERQSITLLKLIRQKENAALSVTEKP